MMCFNDRPEEARKIVRQNIARLLCVLQMKKKLTVLCLRYSNALNFQIFFLFIQTCLTDCQSDKTVTTHCDFPQNDCKNDKILADCPNKDKATATNKLSKPLACFHDAVQVRKVKFIV